MEKIQKELYFWQNKANETVKRIMNDDYINSLNKIIDVYVFEAEGVN
jgi:hypothetical protein